MRSHINAYNAVFPGYWKCSVSQISYHFILLSTMLLSKCDVTKVLLMLLLFFLAYIYLFKVNNRNTRAMCDICSNLASKTPEQHHWLCSDIFIVYFENISHIVHVFPLWNTDFSYQKHCVKCVQIWSFFWSVFSRISII